MLIQILLELSVTVRAAEIGAKISYFVLSVISRAPPVALPLS